jgi:hypothetical protein
MRRLEETEEKLPYLPTEVSLQKSSTPHNVCSFINAFKKRDLFVLGRLVEDGAT